MAASVVREKKKAQIMRRPAQVFPHGRAREKEIDSARAARLLRVHCIFTGYSFMVLCQRGVSRLQWIYSGESHLVFAFGNRLSG